MGHFTRRPGGGNRHDCIPGNHVSSVIRADGSRIASKCEKNAYAKRMSKCPTEAERIFGQRLRRAGIPFKAQKVVGFYIADFIVTDRVVAIELDGGYHDSPTQRERDRRRDEFIHSSGIPVIRIPNAEAGTWDLANLEAYPVRLNNYKRLMMRVGNNRRRIAQAQNLVANKRERRLTRKMFGLGPESPITCEQLAAFKAYDRQMGHRIANQLYKRN